MSSKKENQKSTSNSPSKQNSHVGGRTNLNKETRGTNRPPKLDRSDKK